MDIRNLKEQEFITYASLFLLISKAGMEGIKLDKATAKTAHNYISELLKSDNLTQKEKDELSDMAIYIDEETEI